MDSFLVSSGTSETNGNFDCSVDKPWSSVEKENTSMYTCHDSLTKMEPLSRMETKRARFTWKMTVKPAFTHPEAPSWYH